jgi:hypothetical protein
MKKWIFKNLFWIGLLLTAILTAGCGDGGGDNADVPTGTLQVSLTDEAFPEYSELWISIKEVRAAPAGKEKNADSGLPLITTFDPPLKVNVLTLQFVQQSLGEAVLPAGKYHQIRLILEENNDPNNPANYVVITPDPLDPPGTPEEVIPIKTPSAQTAGLKINAEGTFEIKAGEINTIILDFDPEKGLVDGTDGMKNFKPTGVRIVQVANDLVDFGGINGILDPNGTYASGIVSAVNSDSVTVASGQVNPNDGSFRIFLPQGTYEIRATADNYQPFSSAPTTYDVIVGQDTPAGTITLTPTP